MMSLTHKVIQKIELPHEPGQWIEVRMPSLSILDRARNIRSRSTMERLSGLDFSKLVGMYNRDEATGQSIGEDVDWPTLLNACILSWSYDEPVTPENVEDLDEQTVMMLVLTLLGYDTEEERKKGSIGSTALSKVEKESPRNGSSPASVRSLAARR